MLLAVVVLPGNIQDREGAKAVLLETLDDAPNLELIWADQGYSGKLEHSVPIVCGCKLEIVLRHEPGFKVLPRALGG